jgi:hypothetical protein
MPLIDDVAKVCERLAPKGWDKLLKKHGLDITKADLEAELAKDLPGIDRDVPGFEDFASEGRRAIDPGNPARSLLYHAIASPNVLQVDRKDLKAYPTLAEIEAVENYVFAAKLPSLADLNALAAGNLIAIVVFAYDYRPAIDTVQRNRADLCFSRTGVARVGTKPAFYEARHRGFLPFIDKDDDHAIRVLPARYAPYVAVQRLGDENAFGPMRFSFQRQNPAIFPGSSDPGDETRKFWVPIHKLFSGTECIRGMDLQVELRAHHVNEKIRRIHIELTRRGEDTGHAVPEIDQPPFRFTEDIAALDAATDSGKGLLIPVPHAALVEAAVFLDRPLTFVVPAIPSNDFAPSLQISSEADGSRHAPEYVHVRHAPDERLPNLNDLADPATKVLDGGFNAQHYVDFTGDGWIEPICPQLRPELPRFIAAYSVVTAPDFFVLCDQRELMDWWLQRAPSALRKFIWETPPKALSDERIAPNLKLNNSDFHPGDRTLPNAGFRSDDDTAPAIVSMPVVGPVVGRPLIEMSRDRHNCLPDGAAGVFAPGWDTSFDVTDGTPHMAAYGLGSPFPEDAKLCAALSTFWPAAAPDAGRTFSQVFPTVSPLTDEEIGQRGNLPWDGVAGPRPTTTAAKPLVEYADFDHVDYVESALDGKFSLRLTGAIGTARYIARVLAMARAYRALGVTTRKAKALWNVLSFREIQATDLDLKAAQEAAGGDILLNGDLFRFEMYQPTNTAKQPADFRRKNKAVTVHTILFVGGNSRVLVKSDTASWKAIVVNV